MNCEVLPRNVEGRRTCDKTTRSSAGAAGFTLIEVVLALTIFALMGGILYGAFSLSHSAVEKSQVNSTRTQKQRSIADLLGSYVRSTFPYRESPQEQTAFFEGDGEIGRNCARASEQRIGRRWTDV